MSFVNYHSKEVNCKIVYYGPGLGGKTTNLQHVYKKTSKDVRSEMITLNTENERTLFFDFLPLDLGEIRGFKTRFHLYTVPGQVFYEASRKLILRGLDGIIFVADSQLEKMESNIESLKGLENNKTREAYLIYFKANARGYATHDEILVLKHEINKQKLKFYTSAFGINDFYSNVIKKALYNPNSTKEIVLYDFQMLKDAREKSDFDSTALQKVIFENNNISFKWIK